MGEGGERRKGRRSEQGRRVGRVEVLISSFRLGSSSVSSDYEQKKMY